MVTSNPFSAIFGRSPFQPLLLHIVKVSECADELLPFFESTLSGDWAAAERHRGAITRIEHEAVAHVQHRRRAGVRGERAVADRRARGELRIQHRIELGAQRGGRPGTRLALRIHTVTN